MQPPHGIWLGETPFHREEGGLPLDGGPWAPQVLKGKLHGAIDVRQSVMSVNKKAQRVDLDTEENIYHLKVWGHPLGAGGGAWRGLGCPFPHTNHLSHRSNLQSSLPAG